jgi:SPP1 gp7 family putative phage head morphogenesis protein
MSGFSFLEAIAYAEKRGIVLPEEYYGKLAGLQRQQAVSIAGLGTVEQIKFVIDKLNETLKGGGTFKEFQDAVKAGSLNIDLPKHRLDNIFRTNMQVAYNRGRWEQQTRVSGSRPYLMYSAINDTRVRPTHLAWDNLVLPRGDPFWTTHYPPNGYRCRCTAISLSKAQAERRGISKTSPAGDPDKGWDYNPGADYAPAVTKLVDKKLDKLPPAMKAGADKLKGNIAEKKVEVAEPPTHLKVIKRLEAEIKATEAAEEAAHKEYRALEDKAWSTGRVADKLALAAAGQKRIREIDRATRRLLEALFTDKSTWGEVGSVINLAGIKSGRLRDKVLEAEEFVRKLVRAEVRPNGLGLTELPRGGRAYASGRSIFVNEDTSVSVIVHEIVHHLEFNHPDVLKKTVAFLNRRAGKGVPLKRLSEISKNRGYKSDELAWEDEFAKRGGSPYTGKFYQNKATEILTMGIERMMRDPLDFYKKDPEYFNFLLEIFHG